MFNKELNSQQYIFNSMISSLKFLDKRIDELLQNKDNFHCEDIPMWFVKDMRDMAMELNGKCLTVMVNQAWDRGRKDV